MNCKNCGAENENQSLFCVRCGASLQEQAAQPAAQAQPQATYVAPPMVQQVIPEAYKPLSPWMYFGLMLLFSIPVVGLIFLIIFSFDDGNLNRRNFARSYWINMLFSVVIFIVMFVFLLIFGFTMADVFNEMMYY